MAKLYFNYGVMGSGKSLDLIRTAYNYKERGMNPIVLKPSKDTREGEEPKIKSRTNLECGCELINDDKNIYEMIKNYLTYMEIDVVIVDEVQFLTIKQIEELSDIATLLDIPVLTYGLKNNFKGEIFTSVTKLLALCDSIKEIKGICWCGRKATQNAKIIDGKVVKDGDEICIGGNETYTALCTKHFKEGNLGN